MVSKLEITQGKGLNITFENGWTASVQWGTGNYCSNHWKSVEGPSSTAEVAAWKDKESHVFADSLDSTVKGYLTADEVVDFLNMVRSK